MSRKIPEDEEIITVYMAEAINKTFVLESNQRGVLQGPPQAFREPSPLNLYSLVEELMWLRNKLTEIVAIAPWWLRGKVEGRRKCQGGSYSKLYGDGKKVTVFDSDKRNCCVD